MDTPKMDVSYLVPSPSDEEAFGSFGLCPECRKLDIFDHGMEQYGVCHEHEVWWTIGRVFGSEYLTEEQEREAERILREYQEVSPYWCDSQEAEGHA